MSTTAWMLDREIKCRCGQMGVISGVEEVDGQPDCVWVNHLVGLNVQSHIHRQRQMPGLLAQLQARSERDAQSDGTG